MEIIIFLVVFIAWDAYCFLNRGREEERIYKRTVEDVNWNREKYR